MTPPLFDCMEVIGKEKVLQRIADAIDADDEDDEEDGKAGK